MFLIRCPLRFHYGGIAPDEALCLAFFEILSHMYRAYAWRLVLVVLHDSGLEDLIIVTRPYETVVHMRRGPTGCQDQAR